MHILLPFFISICLQNSVILYILTDVKRNILRKQTNKSGDLYNENSFTFQLESEPVPVHFDRIARGYCHYCDIGSDLAARTQFRP